MAETLLIVITLGTLFTYLGTQIADATWERGAWLAYLVTLPYAAFAGCLLGAFAVWWYFE